MERVREREPRVLRRSGARGLDAGGVRSQPRDGQALGAGRRRRLRLLRKPFPLLLGLPPARDLRPDGTPRALALASPKTRRTRGRAQAARALPPARHGDRDRRQGLRRSESSPSAQRHGRHDHPTTPQRRTRQRPPPRTDPATNRDRSSGPARTSSPSNATAPAPSPASASASYNASSASQPPSPSTTNSAAQPRTRQLLRLTPWNQSSRAR